MQTLDFTNSTAGVRLWESLINTKIFIPRLPPNLVSRERLIRRINANVGASLMLMVAPAGFGKTTLLAQWVQQSDRPVAWVSIDGDECSLGELIVYILSALRNAFTQIDEAQADAIQEILSSSEPMPPHVLEAKLFDVLFNISIPFTLIFDDYHNLVASEVHTFIGWLLEHAPGNMNVIIASRTLPPLPLPKLRARGVLREIRTVNLRFELEEAEELLTKVMDLDLSPSQIALLEGRTEGWVVGLKLAALSLQDGADTKGFVNSFTGTNHYVIDYLCDEVLSRQSEETLEFLLKTSILRRFSGELCDAVTGGSNGQSMVEEIERADLFLVPLDMERHWYRYHHLFGDLLKLRLQRTYPESVRELHSRAREWYVAHDFIDDAIRHAIEGQDWDKVVELVDRVAPSALSMLVSFPKLGTWLRSLPQETLEAQPVFALWHAGAHLLAGEMREYERSLSIVERAWRDTGAGRNKALLFAQKSIAAMVRGEGLLAVLLCSQALQFLSLDYSVERARATLCLGAGHNLAGNPIAGEAYISEARMLTQQLNQPIHGLTQFLLANLAEAKRLRGKFGDALQILDEAIAFAKKSGMDALPHVYVERGIIFLPKTIWMVPSESSRQRLLSAKRPGSKCVCRGFGCTWCKCISYGMSERQ